MIMETVAGFANREKKISAASKARKRVGLWYFS